MSDVTQFLGRVKAGDPSVAEDLLPLVYAELRRLAANKMAHEPADHTLQATALVHEAYVRLVGGNQPQHWNSRGHFFAAAAECMRRILVEGARRRMLADKVGERQRQDALLDANLSVGASPEELLDLDAALERLSEIEPETAQIVKLRFFAGLSVDQVADAAGVSSRTARRALAYGKAWLRRQIDADRRGGRESGP